MPLKKSYADYYTAAQAMKALGVTEGMFYNFIRNGDLEGTKPPGRKQSLYNKLKVDMLARDLQAFMAMSATQKQPIRFMKGTVDDMEDCAQLVKSIFGVAPNAERRRSWLEKNPDVCWIVKVADRIVGLVFALPLTQEKINAIFTTERIPPILADDIQTYEPGKPTHLYIVSMGVLPSSQTNRRLWGARLIAGLMKSIIDLGRLGIVIEDISARSIYPDGIELMRHIGFTEISSITDQRNFIINIADSGLPTVLEYKAALAKYQGKEPPAVPPSTPPKYPKATLCPNCGDIDIEEYTFIRQGHSHQYICTKCGYEENR
ncbi:MAG TPA: hypothetical protein VNG51_11345 [Ktedonobacteraceae bacterium]|nr:hypothetical protein [Ktedonobacteraceae bacterium]